MRAAADAGLRLFGENYVKEAESKIQALSGQGIEWHFIGRLQSNKVNKALELFSMVQSVHSLELAKRMSESAAAKGKKIEILAEVNLAGEGSKTGFCPSELLEMIGPLTELPGLEMCGLMCIPPYAEEGAKNRPYFKQLAALADEIDKRALPRWKRRFLSMGMSDDFEVAIEEGANMVRLGRAIFGQRKK